MAAAPLTALSFAALLAVPGEVDATPVQLEKAVAMVNACRFHFGDGIEDGIEIHKARVVVADEDWSGQSVAAGSVVATLTVRHPDILKAAEENDLDRWVALIGQTTLPRLVDVVKEHEAEESQRAAALSAAERALEASVEKKRQSEDDANRLSTLGAFGSQLVGTLGRLVDVLDSRPAPVVNVAAPAAPEFHAHVNVEAPKRGPMRARNMADGSRVYEPVE